VAPTATVIAARGQAVFGVKLAVIVALTRTPRVSRRGLLRGSSGSRRVWGGGREKDKDKGSRDKATDDFGFSKAAEESEAAKR